MIRCYDKTQDYSFLLNYFNENDILPHSFIDDRVFMLSIFNMVKRGNSPEINIRERDQLNYENHDHFPLRAGTPISMVVDKELPSPSKFGNRK